MRNHEAVQAMLDFNKLIPQIEKVGQQSLSDLHDEGSIVANADTAYEGAFNNAQQLADRLAENAALVWWPLAQPLEPFGTSYPVQQDPQAITVVAVDGSQIMPTHHEVHGCYLINVGLASISYGAKFAPILASDPRLYHSTDDLYPLIEGRRVHVDELYVSLQRNLLELETLLAASMDLQSRSLPVISMFDGTLIPWSLERLPESYQREYNSRLMQAFDGFMQNGIPLVSYLSYPRSCDIVNVLRVSICPFELSRCRVNCGHLNEEQYPCSRIWPLSDRQLLIRQVDLEHRSPAFRSGWKAAQALPEPHKICFCYLNTGYEIARLEFPRWLFGDRTLFQLMLSAVAAQCKKGLGYPIALSEAHHLAVVRSKDRERFFEAITKHLMESGIKRVRVSPKESTKRGGFV